MATCEFKDSRRRLLRRMNLVSKLLDLMRGQIHRCSPRMIVRLGFLSSLTVASLMRFLES